MASPVKPVKATAGRWWRFSDYEIRDQYIRPTADARLEAYDPWKMYESARDSSNQDVARQRPYTELLGLPGRFTLRPGAGLTFDDDSLRAVLQWVRKYGLLGVLLQETLAVHFPSQRVTQRHFIRMPGGWSSFTTSRRVTSGVIVDNASGGFRLEPLSTWWRYFPGSHHRGSVFPAPLSPQFWKLYSEPVISFYNSVRTLKSALKETEKQSQRARDRFGPRSGAPILRRLLGTVSVDVVEQSDGSCWRHRWAGSTLLGVLAMMLALDRSNSQVLICRAHRCGRVFVSSHYEARFCSNRCRWREGQRKSRRSRKGTRRAT